jgi:hypothetical protein
MSQNAFLCHVSKSEDFNGNVSINADVPPECAAEMYKVYNKYLMSEKGPFNIFSGDQIYQDVQGDDDVSQASTITQASVHSIVLDQDFWEIAGDDSRWKFTEFRSGSEGIGFVQELVQEQKPKQKSKKNRCAGGCGFTGSFFGVDENGTRTSKYHCRACAYKTGIEMKTRAKWKDIYDVKHNNSVVSTAAEFVPVPDSIDVFPEENFVFSDNVCTTRGDRRKNGTGCKCKTNTCKGFECKLTGSFFGRSENGVRNTPYYCSKCSYKVPNTVMKNHTQWKKMDNIAEMGF